MVKIKIDSGLYDRAKRAAEAAGYSSVDEFIAHCIENELLKSKTAAVPASGAEPAAGAVETPFS